MRKETHGSQRAAEGLEIVAEGVSRGRTYGYLHLLVR
jgi:hypothetical protein